MFQAQGQPNDTMLPISYTTTETTVGPGVTNDWTLDTLGQFVNVTSGAVAIAIGRQWADQTTTVYINIQVPSLIPSRAYLLLVPGVVMVILIIILVILDVCVHRITKTPRMRDMGLVEWTDSILNENLLGGVHAQGNNVPELNVSYHGMN
jgi:cellobiose-specific phosphotransferase system component IIC